MGLTGGGLHYYGELNQHLPLKSINPAGGLFLRINYTAHHALRAHVFAGNISGDDAKSKNAFQNYRNHSFSSLLIDMGVQGEFNFFPYILGSDKKNERFSPYISSGLTIGIVPNNSQLLFPTFSFGTGFKNNLSKNLGWGLEWSFRRTFSDKLDNLQGIDYRKSGGYDFETYKQKAYYHNKDWYSFVNIFLHFRISNKNTECRAYD